MSGRKNRGAGKTILLILYVLLFLSGLSLLLYPKLNAIWIDYMLWTRNRILAIRPEDITILSGRGTRIAI